MLDRRYYAIGPVIEGYSVKDAADILGIPVRRVWELVARGVLASSPEGPDGMLVYLQPHPAQQPTAPASPISERRSSTTDEPDPPRHNGNGGVSGEMSPFRELLTEFRSLTERYGQALLALGEARGEVAALRTRVELLEARMDLRLPSTRPASTVAWEIPDLVTEPAPAAADEPEHEAAYEAELTYMDEGPAAATPVFEPAELVEPEQVEPVEPTAEAVNLVEPEEAAVSDEPVADVHAEHEAEPEQAETDITAAEQKPLADVTEPHAEAKPRRSRGRPALAGFAEALARAQDPTLAQLPGAEDAAQALAALRAETEASRGAAPPEEATAPEPAADEAPSEPIVRDMSPYSTEIVEPDWFADGDFTWLEAEVTAAEADVVESADTETAVADEVQADSAPGIEPATEELGAVEVMAEPELSVQAIAPEPFEPTPEAQAIAEEEARAAIQDAFDEPAAVTRDTVLEAETDQAVPEPEPESDAIQEAFAEVETPPAWPQSDSAWTDMEPELAAEPEAQPVALDEQPTAATSEDVDVATPPEEFIAPPVMAQPSSAAPEMPVADRKGISPAGEEELMWLGDEFEEAGLEVASEGWRSAGAPGSPPPVLELSDAELSQLAEDEGWDMAEVEAIRSLLGRSSEVAPEVEPAVPQEQTEPQAQADPADTQEQADPPAMDETPRDETWDETPWTETPAVETGDETPMVETQAIDQAESEPTVMESAEEPAAELPNAEPPAIDAPAQEMEPAPGVSDPPPNYESPSASASAPSAMPPTRSFTAPTADPDWLRGRRGPAATAYRRLRRLFPN